MPIRTAIVDDEILARQILVEYISKIDHLELVLDTGNPLEFVNYQHQNEIDLIFLDIDMPEITGIEILKSMIKQPKVILTTAYSEYALESYEYGIVDYLLKPIKFERFLKAINKVSDKTANLEPKEETKNKELQIKHDGMPLNIALDSILYIQSFGNYLRIFTKDRMYLITETLTNIVSFLPETFQRTHKSYIANLDQVKKIVGSNLIIEEKKIPISPMYKIIVQQKMG